METIVPRRIREVQLCAEVTFTTYGIQSKPTAIEEV